MTEAAPAREATMPRWVPALLNFVAGYVDSYTFLALFGLFVAQVTGSFVTARRRACHSRRRHSRQGHRHRRFPIGGRAALAGFQEYRTDE